MLVEPDLKHLTVTAHRLVAAVDTTVRVQVVLGMVTAEWWAVGA